MLKNPDDPEPLDGKSLEPALLKNPGEPGIVDTVFPEPALPKKPGEPGTKEGELLDPALLKNPGDPGAKIVVPEPDVGIWLGRVLLNSPVDPDVTIGTNLNPLLEKPIGIGFPTIGRLSLSPEKLF